MIRKIPLASCLAVRPVRIGRQHVVGKVKHGHALDKRRDVLLKFVVCGIVFEEVLALAGGSESDGKSVRVLALERVSKGPDEGRAVLGQNSPPKQLPVHCPSRC